MTDERLLRLRELMKERNISVYIVPTADFHESEYVGDYFRARAYLTGFTGSAGTAAVTADAAALFTDGRYFIQAEQEIAGSGFTLYRMGEQDVPTLEEFVRDSLPQGGTVGFDGRVVNARTGKKLEEIARKKGGSVAADEDLVGMIWEDRPPRSREEAWVLEGKYAGESAESKMSRVREEMKACGAAVHILTSLDDIAWLLNLRGNDIPHCPVVLSYLMLTEKGCVLYIQNSALTKSVKSYLARIHVSIAPYEDIYKIADMMSEKRMGKVLLDCGRTNYRIVSAVEKANRIVDRQNPTLLMKAVKSPEEVNNIRAAHVKDGVAMVKWLYWLKNTVGKEKLTEITAADYLEKMRREQEGFVDLSFGTISAYGANAAMMHYSAKPETAAELKPEHFLLVDSGGHYLEGSTDITRTVALGPLTDEEKLLYTAVLRGNMHLAAARFLYGCTGRNLDILAREPLWEMFMDYKCGTGHGIGYLLNVHEAPNGFRWKAVPERDDSAVLEEGMITTDEPGVYIEGNLGIRIENELLCLRSEENEYGQFMEFEVLTLCPADLSAVVVSELSPHEKALLNAYHEIVYRELSPYLTKEERLWLRYETREV